MSEDATETLASAEDKTEDTTEIAEIISSESETTSFDTDTASEAKTGEDVTASSSQQITTQTTAPMATQKTTEASAKPTDEPLQPVSKPTEATEPAKPAHTHSYDEFVSKDEWNHTYKCSCGATQTSSHECVDVNNDEWYGAKCKICGHKYVTYDFEKLEQELFKLINKSRKEAGLRELSYRAELQCEADRRAKEITTDFRHSGNYGGAFAENIAYGYNSAEEANEAFMNSPGHRSNMLHEAAHSVAVSFRTDSEGTLYCEELFFVDIDDWELYIQ